MTVVMMYKSGCFVLPTNEYIAKKGITPGGGRVRVASFSSPGFVMMSTEHVSDHFKLRHVKAESVHSVQIANLANIESPRVL